MRRCIDGDGAVLCPGLVDMRAALGEPGFEYRETIASAAAAAAAGGITTLAALPDTRPAIDDPALVRLLRARGEETGSLTILPYGAVTRGCRGEELAELGLLREAGAVAFTDGAPRDRLGAADAAGAVLRARLRRARSCSTRRSRRSPSGGAATEGELATRLGLPGIPAAAEAILVARDIRLARADRRGGAFRPCLHRRGAGADPARQGRRAGGHLRHRAALFRPERDRDRRFPHLRQAVAAAARGGGPAGGGGRAGRRHDRRDRVATTSRATPTTSACPSRRPRAGGAGLATLLGVTLAQVHGGALPLPRAIALLTARAGRAAGQRRPARWRRARPADLCLFHPERIWQVEAGALPGKAQNTPFDGRALEGRVLGHLEGRAAGVRMSDACRCCDSCSGYLLGSIPFGLLLTRAAGLGDIRAIGSRQYRRHQRAAHRQRAGWPAATLLLDGGKGAAAVLLARRLWPGSAAALWAGFGAVLGHLFPVWLGFRGGKGVATGFGVLIAAAWPVGLLAGAVWLAMARIVAHVLGRRAGRRSPPRRSGAAAGRPATVALLALAIAVLVFARHHANIRRLLAGTEPRIGNRA